MPSAANPKLEKQASTEVVDNTPIRQAIVVIEHKIRNLEKRKGKLEGYRDLQKSGKELNADQKVAVAKYDEVINTIEFARELIKSFNVISTSSEKEAKKLARKETLQRVQQNLQNIREVLLIQDILSELGADEVRSQFLAGENGAIQLSEEDFTLLDKLYEEITPKREDSEESFNVLLQRSSEHMLAIIEGKPKEAFGRTYTSIRDLLKSIASCEYFAQSKTEVVNDTAVPEEADNTDIDNVVETDTSESPQLIADSDLGNQLVSVEAAEESHVHQNLIPQQTASLPHQVNISSRPAVNAEAPAPNAVPTPAFPPPQHQQMAPALQALPTQVIPQVPPGIVPVVAAQPLSVPNAALPHLPTVQSVEHAYFAQQQYMQQQQQQQQQRPITDMIQSNAGFYFLQESELDSPEVTAPVSGQPPLITPGAPRNTPPPSGHSAVSAPQPGPIPTQTFTSQTFPGVPPMPNVATPMFPTHPVPTPTQVPVPEMNQQHIPGFTNPNMPIPMPQQSQSISQQPVSVSQPLPSSVVQTQQFTSQPVSVPFPVSQTQTATQVISNSSKVITQSKPEEEKIPSGDVPEKTDWCESEPEPVANITTNAWHQRQQNQKQHSSGHDSTPDGSNVDWSNDAAAQETWSGQGDGYNRGGFRGRGARIGNRGGNTFRGRGGNASGNNYREQNGSSGRPNSGNTYYRNNDQQSNYYQNQNGGSSNYNRDNQGYQGGYVYRGRGRGAPRGSANASRPGQRTTGQPGMINSRGSRGGNNNPQHIRRENTATAKQ